MWSCWRSHGPRPHVLSYDALQGKLPGVAVRWGGIPVKEGGEFRLLVAEQGGSSDGFRRRLPRSFEDMAKKLTWVLAEIYQALAAEHTLATVRVRVLSRAGRSLYILFRDFRGPCGPAVTPP